MKFQGLTTWFLEKQTRITLNLLTLLSLLHIYLPWARPYTSQFFTLSAYNPTTGKYATSSGDLCFVTFFVVVSTGLRASAIDRVLRPLGRRWGISKQRAAVRFAEQAWLWLYSSSSYYLRMEALWTGWLDRELSGLMKAYFLTQLAFWIQQMMMVHVEKRRSDHWQMVLHQIVTILLVGGSYAYHQTKVGHLIMVLMDTVELFLPLAKCLKYLELRMACDVAFGVFMAWWSVARHILFIRICWSIYAELPRVVPSGCYVGEANDLRGPLPVPDNGWSHLIEPLYNPAGIICWDDAVRWAVLYCLLLLQALLVMWFTLILRVAKGLLNGKTVEDQRSDDEGAIEVGVGEVEDGKGEAECVGEGPLRQLRGCNRGSRPTKAD
ncbi:hypothetical protein PCL_08337 [Purpureocillium lilacinum]|uniref:TLC domain-containing protein n=1 Tax=Purpureocillium lilacinum TaxID=33203 RepID=A0A2U3DRU6_PURLI|nr:hypothetical protein PCL_08337 [Purpureocillium lilacinum]